MDRPTRREDCGRAGSEADRAFHTRSRTALAGQPAVPHADLDSQRAYNASNKAIKDITL